MRGSAAAIAAVLAVACGRSHGDATASPSASASAPTASALAPPSSPSPSPSPSADAVVTWRGNYKSTPSTLPEVKSAQWSSKDTSTGVGEGTLTLTIDSSGRALGSLEGPLGPASVDGLVADGKLTASVARKDPSDRGFTGTLSASVASDRIEGTMTLSLAQATALRTAAFSLTPR